MRNPNRFTMSLVVFWFNITTVIKEELPRYVILPFFCPQVPSSGPKNTPKRMNDRPTGVYSVSWERPEVGRVDILLPSHLT